MIVTGESENGRGGVEEGGAEEEERKQAGQEEEQEEENFLVGKAQRKADGGRKDQKEITTTGE